MKKEHLKWLQTNKACNPSIRWIKQNNIQSLENAWYACERGDWLLWMAEKLKVDKYKLVLCGALCAHTVVQYMEDARSREAVRIAFLWGRGKATDEQLREARGAAATAATYAAYTATYAAYTATTAYADAAAAYAAYTATTAYVATDAADAAEAAATNGVDARQANQLRTAEIARKILTEDVLEKIKYIK